MAVLALYNIKGGVGKTTTAVNIAYLAAQTHGPTLLMDLDPQGSASFYFRVVSESSFNLKKMLKGGGNIEKNIKASNYPDLDILPADFSYRKMDLKLDAKKRPKSRLSSLVKPLRDAYEVIVLDCPPNITLESENIFRATDYLLVPVIPTPLSMQTYEILRKYLGKIDLDERRVIPFFNLVDRRRKLQKELIASVLQKDHNFCIAEVPYCSDVEKTGLNREPVGARSKSSRGSKAFAELWKEVSARIFNPLD